MSKSVFFLVQSENSSDLEDIDNPCSTFFQSSFTYSKFLDRNFL